MPDTSAPTLLKWQGYLLTEAVKREGHPPEEGGGGGSGGKRRGAVRGPRPHHSLPDMAHFQSVSVLHAAALQSQNDRLR